MLSIHSSFHWRSVSRSRCYLSSCVFELRTETGCGVHAWAEMSAAEDAQDGLDLTGARIISTTECTGTLMCSKPYAPSILLTPGSYISRIVDLGRMHVNAAQGKRRDAPSISLPQQQADCISHIALDIGGSLIKLVYFSPEGGPSPSTANGRAGGQCTHTHAKCLQLVLQLAVQ